jgi:hypothetical protein
LLNSRAFAALHKAGIVMVLAMLSRLRYDRPKKDRKGVKAPARLKDGGAFYVTINELRARGLSATSATEGRKEAWRLGFFDVESPGTIHHAGRYRYSNRWRQYPNGPYEPIGQEQPGANVYPAHGFQKKDKNSECTRASELSSQEITHVDFPCSSYN